MSPASIEEYAAALRGRYRQASKREKGALLDAFCATTGYHRKAAVRRLRRTAAGARQRPGRPPQYDAAVQAALERTWEAADRPCGKRLAPFLAEFVPLLERHGELTLSEPARRALVGMSAATIDRRLAAARSRLPRRPYAPQPAATALRAQIPLRTFGEWEGVAPGAFQADLVAHCGESTAGFSLTTLLLVDVATGWTEVEAIWGKGHIRVHQGVRRIRLRLPLPLRELHTDNGGEFLNHLLVPWCRREGIRLSRGRPYRKNDQAWVEQRNWMVVRRLVGYDRFSSHGAHAQLQAVYDLARLYLNFFQPLRKLVHKERHDAKVRKRYDRAQTPYQRVVATGVLSPTQHEGLERLYQRLNPVQLRVQLDAALAALWTLAEPPSRSRASVLGTGILRHQPLVR